MTTSARTCRSFVLAASLALVACTSSALPSSPAQEPHAMTDAAVASPYNDKPVQAKLGPHRFEIPANYFDTQLGPDFQGNMRLIVQWPDLQPLAPGVRYFDDQDRFRKGVNITPSFIDRVPLDSLLERIIRSDIDSPQAAQEDPSLNIDLRLRGEPVFGLQPYYLDFHKLDAYLLKQHGDKVDLARQRESALNRDWFVQRDAQGKLTTVITCSAREMPDGVVLDGDTLEQIKPPIATCEHSLILPRYNTRVTVEYLRVFLKDWQRIDARVRGLFDQYHSNAAP